MSTDTRLLEHRNGVSFLQCLEMCIHNEPITVASLQQQLMRNMRERNREYGDITYTFPAAFLEKFIQERNKP